MMSKGMAMIRRMGSSRDPLSFGAAARRLAAIDPLAQLLARLEERDRLFVHRHRLAGARVAAGAGVSALDSERAEAAQFHPFPARQRPGDLFENSGHDQLHVPPREVRIGCRELRDQFGPGHRPAPGFAPETAPRVSALPRLPERPRSVNSNPLEQKCFLDRAEKTSKSCAEGTLDETAGTDILDGQVGRDVALFLEPAPCLRLPADLVDQAEAQGLSPGIGAPI